MPSGRHQEQSWRGRPKSSPIREAMSASSSKKHLLMKRRETYLSPSSCNQEIYQGHQSQSEMRTEALVHRDGARDCLHVSKQEAELLRAKALPG